MRTDRYGEAKSFCLALLVSNVVKITLNDLHWADSKSGSKEATIQTQSLQEVSWIVGCAAALHESVDFCDGHWVSLWVSKSSQLCLKNSPNVRHTLSRQPCGRKVLCTPRDRDNRDSVPNVSCAAQNLVNFLKIGVTVWQCHSLTNILDRKQLVILLVNVSRSQSVSQPVGRSVGHAFGYAYSSSVL
jgi:hypothetical protein